MADEDPHETKPIRHRNVPAPHEGHRIARCIGPALRCLSNHAQLEYHRDDCQGAPGIKTARQESYSPKRVNYVGAIRASHAGKTRHANLFHAPKRSGRSAIKNEGFSISLRD